MEQRMELCWVLTEHQWPHRIKTTSSSWRHLWEFSAEESIGKPISLIQTNANEISAAMLMRRFYTHENRGTKCTNASKFGRKYTHITYITSLTCGLLAISTQIEPRSGRLTLREKVIDAHSSHPPLDENVFASVLFEVYRHVGAAGLTHEQRFLLSRASQLPCSPPLAGRRKIVL